MLINKVEEGNRREINKQQFFITLKAQMIYTNNFPNLHKGEPIQRDFN